MNWNKNLSLLSLQNISDIKEVSEKSKLNVLNHRSIILLRLRKRIQIHRICFINSTYVTNEDEIAENSNHVLNKLIIDEVMDSTAYVQI